MTVIGDRPNVARAWAEFAVETRFDDLPADAVHRMKRSLLDCLGVGIIGSQAPSSRAVLSWLREQGGTEEATVLPGGFRTTASNAAYAFGTYVHATELAESFTRATMHAGNAVPPAALAVAEKAGASGRELLAALVVGYEISIRSGLSVRVHPDSPTFAAKDETRTSIIPLFHPVPTFGVYGATAAAGRLLGLTVDEMKHALTMSTAMTPAVGLIRSFMDGGLVKDLYQGFSNSTAVTYAEMAAHGVTGPADVHDHYTVLVEDYEPSLLLRNLGSEYLVSSGGLHFKLHQTAGMTQSAADAMLDALEGQPAIRPEDVAEIVVETNHRGTRPMMTDPDPRTGVAAKVSVPYVTAAVLAYHDELADDPYFLDLYTDDKVDDAPRRALSQRVRIVGSDDLERGFEQEWPMRFGSNVEIRLRGGRSLHGTAEIWSVSANLPDEKVVEKFAHLTRRVLPSADVEAASAAVFGLDGDGTVADVVRLLTA
ncbi:MAG TPA: MmgE/PrpD family protein [Acidimicrobiales bacterium]|nr:MmgE/PrpD family protein [Acidimicrobiales bacterium]